MGIAHHKNALSAGAQVGNQFSLKIGYKLQEVETMTDMRNGEQSAVMNLDEVCSYLRIGKTNARAF